MNSGIYASNMILIDYIFCKYWLEGEVLYCVDEGFQVCVFIKNYPVHCMFTPALLQG
jgi:hypothetical protein